MVRPAELPDPEGSGEEEKPDPIPVGDVAETDWGEWDDSVAFQDSRMPELNDDFDSLPGDVSGIVVEVGPEDTEHFDPFGPPPDSKR